jgi:hypothetical protein
MTRTGNVVNVETVETTPSIDSPETIQPRALQLQALDNGCGKRGNSAVPAGSGNVGA